jgi:hypothetical protein
MLEGRWRARVRSLVEPATARMTQRDVMRNLIRCFNGNHDKVVAAYGAAERRREVSRSSTISRLDRMRQ